MTHIIEGLSGEDAVTELLYAVALAKAEKDELLRVDLLALSGRALTAVRTKLRALLGGGRILAFAMKADFDEKNVRAAYFANKFPALDETGENFVYIKVM